MLKAIILRRICLQAFSDDGSSQTIRALDPSLEHTIGRVYLKRMTFKDIKAVNQMYNCAGEYCALISHRIQKDSILEGKVCIEHVIF